MIVANTAGAFAAIGLDAVGALWGLAGWHDMSDPTAKAEIKSMPYPPRKHAPDYFAVNPTGMVPLLIDGEVRLSESMASAAPIL